jgi:nitroimidazol reductase NimA-like FMN-containing flavoprotein (pyridoxamine 5'-phosphate oxidase superfamily)
MIAAVPRLTPTRAPELMSTDRTRLDALLAATVLGHIGFLDEDGHPVVMPSAVVRWGDLLLTHGSTGSRWLRRIGSGVPVSVSIAVVDGIMVARSAFESALLYRSAVLFGTFSSVEGERKREALDVLTERLIPGRVAEVRASTAKELAATILLSMPMATWSFRELDDWPHDGAEDVAGDAWAGHVRYGPAPVTVVSAPDLRPGIDPPASLAHAAKPV